jgi:acyl-CoA thioester hydrolase
LSELIHAPVLFFAPFVSSPARIEPGWIDYNGHLNLAYYHVLFDKAVDEAFGLIGLGPDYAKARNASYFVAESHVLYKRELNADSLTRVTLHFVDFDDRRMHYYAQIHDAREGWLAATIEALAVHVDLATRKSAPFPADILAQLALMKAAHARLPRPAVLGRHVSLTPRSEEPAPVPATESAQAASGTRH